VSILPTASILVGSDDMFMSNKAECNIAVLVKNRSIFLVDPKDKAYAMFGGFRE